MMLKLPMNRKSDPIAVDVCLAASSTSCFAVETTVVSPPGARSSSIRDRTTSDRAAPDSTPPRFEISVVVRGCAPVPDAAASRSSVPGARKASALTTAPRPSAGQALARHDASDPHRCGCPEDEERDRVSGSRVKSTRQLVVDDHLAGARFVTGQTRPGPAEGGGLSEVHVPQEGDRLRSRHTVAVKVVAATVLRTVRTPSTSGSDFNASRRSAIWAPRAGSAVVSRSSIGPSALTATRRIEVSSESPTDRLLTMRAVPRIEPLTMRIASVRRRAI